MSASKHSNDPDIVPYWGTRSPEASFENHTPAALEPNLIESLEGLKQELATVRDELHEINAIQSPLVGIDQVARYFGKSKDTIRRWTKERIISCYKIPNNKGHAILFSFKQLENDIADYLQERM